MKSPVLILYYVLVAFAIHAQSKNLDTSLSKFYIKAAIGGGIGINGDYNTENNNGKVTNSTTKIGSGVSFIASAGCQFNSNLSAELSLGYFYGLNLNVFPPFDGNSEKLNGSMFQMIPSFVFSTSFGKLRPYIRTGLIIGLPEVYEDYSTRFTDVNGMYHILDAKTEYYDGKGLGIQTSIGCTYTLNTKLSLFGEAILNDINYTPLKGRIISYTVDGADISYLLGSRIFSPSPVNFFFNALSINAGIKFNLSNHNPQLLAKKDKKNNFYSRMSLGYGFSINPDKINSYVTSYDKGPGGQIAYDQIISSSVEYIGSFSGGNGINASIGAGCMLNENIGFDLGLNETISNTLKSPGAVNSSNSVKYYSLSSQSGNMLQINPSLLLVTRIWKFSPYSRLGLLTGFGNVYRTYDTYSQSSNGAMTFDQIHSVWKYYGGASIGYNAVLGMSYPLNSKFDLYTEASFNNIYEIPTNAQMIEYTVNGVNSLNSENTSQKSEVIKASYNTSDNNDPNKPTIESPIKFSFNAIVGSVGIKMRF